MSLPLRIMCHGKPALRIATQCGWLVGARYTNLRDIRDFTDVGLIDIDWEDYDFARHLAAVRKTRPRITIARDLTDIAHLREVLEQAHRLNEWSERVVIVPKDERIGSDLAGLIPSRFLLGYSVPTTYGATTIPIEWFGNRPVHLLGGRPDIQFQLANRMNIHSLDGNRITISARYGNYFTGSKFQAHPVGGYYECIRASLRVVNEMWANHAAGGTEQFSIGYGGLADIEAVKGIADGHRQELGFVLRPSIQASVERKQVRIATREGVLCGYTRFHHRQDGVTTLYEIAVQPFARLKGIGRQLIWDLVCEARKRHHSLLRLKCPVDLPANVFYQRLGFSRLGIERGKRRKLSVWSYGLC